MYMAPISKIIPHTHHLNSIIFVLMLSRPIGIFDSGFGGLTVFKAIKDKLSDYDYVYLGDNARAPYGDRSMQTVYEYTLEAVEYLFSIGCPMIILACNTASAKALRNIQMKDLPAMDAEKRVLGIIRPSAEVIGEYTKTGSIGIVGTRGTVSSNSYVIEIHKQTPDVQVYQQACPMWVSLVENNEHQSEHADFFIKKDLDELLAKSPDIDTILLGCTHYPLLIDKIRKYVPAHISIVPQGDIVANSFADYLNRHPEIEEKITKGGTTQFYTTDDTENFDNHASIFFGGVVRSQHIHL